MTAISTSISLRVNVSRQAGQWPAIIAKIKADTAQRAYVLARRIASNARRLVPVRTGYLRSTIEVLRLGVGNYRVIVGADYGAYVEYGTRHTPAQPFFHPAIRAARAST